MLGGFAAFAGDVWKDCAAYYIGADDKNASGHYDDGELFDICHITDDSRSGSRDSRYNNISILTEDVECATLGRTLSNQKVLYFDGSATVTNTTPPSAATDITGVGNVIQLPDLITNAEFTVLIRFKPDKVHPWEKTYENFLNLGLRNNSYQGFMLCLDSSPNKTGYSNLLRLCYGKRNYRQPFSSISLTNAIFKTRSDTWHELAFVVSKPEEGRVKCRVGLFQPGNGVQAADTKPASMANWEDAYFTVDNEDADGHIGSSVPYTGLLRIGGESATEKTRYRGKIHMLSFWNRALSDDEVRTAFGSPTPGLFQIGSAGSDGAKIFAGGTDSDVMVSSLPENWRDVPSKLVQGKNLTISFDVQTWQTNLTQILQFTPSAGAGMIDVSVNGAVVKAEEPVSAGRTTYIEIPGRLLTSSGANTCTIVRTDDEAADLVPGGIELSGSWQVGLHDGSNRELQSKGASADDFYVADGNWKHARRVVSGTYSATQWFEVPEALAGYPARLRWATAQSQNSETARTLVASLNGVEFFRKAFSKSDDNNVVTCRFPAGSLAAGMNELHWSVESTSSDYVSFDFIRFEITPPHGLILSFR